MNAARNCSCCGHAMKRHDDRLGCCVELGNSGSGSVADAVFCRCDAYVSAAALTGETP